MSWLKLSLKEWQRRPLRICVTAGGVAAAVAALFSLLAFLRGYNEGMHRELERLGAHVLVAPKGCPYDATSLALHGASWPCYLKMQYLDEIQVTPGVAVAAPVFMAAVRPGSEHQKVFVGIDTNMLALKKGWKIQGAFPKERDELLIGASVARRLGWQLEQRVQLPGLSTNTGIVRGILASTDGPDDSFIFLPLKEAQRVFRHPGEMTHVLVQLRDPNQMDGVVNQLRGCNAGLQMSVIPLAPLLRSIQGLVNSTRVLLACITLVAWAAAGTGVSNALLMAVFERTRELGVMRALGASRRDIFKLLWLESVQTCLLGGLAGVLLAFVASREIEGWLRARLPFAPRDALVQWHWDLAGMCLGYALLLGSIAVIFPAWRAARLSPQEAIRSQENIF